MRVALVSAALVAVTSPLVVAAQSDVAPAGLAAIETERSRSCVGTLAEVAALNRRLEPFIATGQRLAALAQAISIEDRTTVEPFDETNPTEVRVRDWFQTDGALAQRYVTNQTATLLAERTAGRETIKVVVTEAANRVETEANALVTENQDLLSRAAPCDGALFIRSVVLEACETGSGIICEQAALPAAEVRGFRFVDSPENVWDLRELRPWTTPAPIRPGPGGQLDGGRTVGFARFGNVVLSVAFSPLLRDRAELTPEQIASFQAVNDSLGLIFDHPTLAFSPALGIRAALPMPLAGESRYVVHFGDPTEPDIVWSGEAGTGRPLEATRPLATRHVLRLQAGQTLSLTAMGGPGGDEPAFTISLSNVNQAQATLGLLGYMREQLGADLNVLMQPRG